MNQLSTIVMLAFTLASLAGCTSLYRVTDSAADRGIPFYPVIPQYQAVATYDQPWVELRLEVERLDSVVKNKDQTETRTTSKVASTRYTTLPLCAARLNAGIVSASDVDEAYGAVKDQMVIAAPKPLHEPECMSEAFALTPPPQVALDKVSGLMMTSVEYSVLQVPSTKPLYINIARPFAGSTSATVTLAANGTLTSAAAAVDDRSAEAIFSELPIGEIVTSMVGLDSGAKTQSLTPKVGSIVSVKLTMTQVHRLYVVKLLSDQKQTKPPEPNALGASVVVKEVRGSENGDDEAKDAGKAIQFNGSIRLPEEKK